MISLIGNRPALQVGRYQVIEYGTDWLDDALQRAALAAKQDDFPFVADIRGGVFQYLESRCPLKLMPLEDLYDRVRRMLVTIGCAFIAEELRPLAPPITVSLIRNAMDAGPGFELAFFAALHHELTELRAAGAECIHFSGLRESTMILCGESQWSPRCQSLLSEIESFLSAHQTGTPQMALP